MTMSPLSLPFRSGAVPEWLRQPPAIALLASLGVHGLLFALWPLLQTAPVAEPVERRPVGVVTLTPAEMARLPVTRSAQMPGLTPPGAIPSPGSLLPPPTLLPPGSLPTPLSLPPLTLPGLDLPPAPVVPEPAPSRPARSSAPTVAQTAPPAAASSAATPADREATDPRLFVFDPTGTDASKAYDQLATVVAEAQKKAPSLEFTTVEKPLELPLPTDACFDQVKPMVLAVTVTPAGKALDDPQVLVSSGYPILNQRAAQALKTRLYPLKPRSRLYVYTLQFKPATEGAAPACAARPGAATGGQ